MSKEILMQHNSLVKSKYNFSSIENKLFYKILYNAQKQSNNNQLLETIITVDELKKIMKKTKDHCYSSIKEKLNLFQQSILEFEYIEETGEKVLFNSQLIAPFKYSEAEQKYTIYIHEVIYNHLTNAVKLQKEGYSAINLAILFNFKGAYTQRFYVLFRQWSRQNKEVEISFTIDQLREYLKIDAGIYPAYKNFKQRVINGALEEINKAGNMEVSIKEEQKQGRKVNKIIFAVKDFEPRKYFEENITEVPAILKDGGEDVEVMQQVLNVDAIEEKSPAGATAEALKYVALPEGILSPEVATNFINYCYNESITFTDSDFIKILKESQEVTKETKGLKEGELIGKYLNAYNYFFKVFLNKVAEYVASLNIPCFHKEEETEAPASEDFLKKWGIGSALND